MINVYRHTKRKLIRKILFLSFCVPTSVLIAQENKPALFLHLDKSLYTGNEIIWFTGYMMNLNKQDADNYSTLYVTLNDPIKKQPLLSSRFVLENGLCQGVLQLPDSFPAGDYSLVAYTDHLFNHPDDAVFQQWISVRYNTSADIPFLQHFKDSSMKETVSAARAILTPDSASYHKRSHTRWKVRLTDTANRPVQGIFSASCVRNTRLGGRESEIQQYARSCFTITNLLKDTIPPFHIQVGFGNKRNLKSPACLLIVHDNSIDIVQTEKDGSFRLSPALLKGSYGTDVIVSVVEKKYQDLYNLSIDENDQWLNKVLAKRDFPFQIQASRSDEVFTREEKEMSRAMLAPAVVKGKRKPDYLRPEYYQLPIIEGPCAAWICGCDHWKCGACPPAHSPVKGSSYLDQSTGMFVTYKGCPDDTVTKPFIKKIKAINYPRSFKGPDFSKEYSDGEFYNTTLYWNYLIVTDKKGEAAFDFYTNDLIGHFTCIIEGVSTAGLISNRQEVTVTSE